MMDMARGSCVFACMMVFARSRMCPNAGAELPERAEAPQGTSPVGGLGGTVVIRTPSHTLLDFGFKIPYFGAFLFLTFLFSYPFTYIPRW